MFADDAFFDAVRRELERLDANRADAFARILRVPRERDAIARGAAKVAAAVARAEDARARRADARMLAILDASAGREREGKRRRT